jgi:hypothetical protein
MQKIINRFFILIIGLFSSLSLVAQDLNNSPYTRYGLGEVFDFGNSAYSGIGNASVALSTLGQINYANPATYSQVRRYSPILDAGYRVNILTNQTNVSSQRNVISGLRNFGLALPISPKTGLVLGLMPYSTTGYNLQNKQLNGTDTITYLYSGRGSVNRAIIGFGQEIINKSDSVSLTRLAVGFNASFLFGTIQRDRNLIFDNKSFYNTRITNKTIVRGFTFDLGVHFTEKINKGTTIQFGLNYGFGNHVNTFSDFYAYNFRYSNFDVEIEKDTLEFLENSKGKINLPSTLAIGAAISFNSKWLVTAQYSFYNWQNYSEVFNDVESFDPNLRQSKKASLGFEYTPKNDFDSRDVSSFSLSTYRFGIHYGYSPFYLANTHLTDYGINFGVTIPLINSNTWSTVNLGCQVGKMGTINNELIQQNYFKINLGFNLSPNKKFDKWFYKRLYE